MADPRNAISFEGIGAEFATFLIDNSTIVYSATTIGGSASVGLAVTLSGNGTVALAADGDAVIGKLVRVESDNKANVQVDGYTTLPGGTSATLTRGTHFVGALLSAAKGYIRSAASATAAELILCDGRIIDASDTTAVVVDLG